MKGNVIDTNVFVAAGFNPRSASARILTGLREGRFRLIWNEPTRRETQIILRRIPRLDWEKVADLYRPEGKFTGSVLSEGAGKTIRHAYSTDSSSTRRKR
jgi:predicted nucleic acid-binding protein